MPTLQKEARRDAERRASSGSLRLPAICKSCSTGQARLGHGRHEYRLEGQGPSEHRILAVLWLSSSQLSTQKLKECSIIVKEVSQCGTASKLIEAIHVESSSAKAGGAEAFSGANARAAEADLAKGHEI